jgi:hypothetical protein
MVAMVAVMSGALSAGLLRLAASLLRLALLQLSLEGVLLCGSRGRSGCLGLSLEGLLEGVTAGWIDAADAHGVVLIRKGCAAKRASRMPRPARAPAESDGAARATRMSANFKHE